jgi:hypothetical protein
MTVDRGRRSRPAPAVPVDSDAASTKRPRRVVMNDARRKVERALWVADAAEDLAEAARAVLTAAEAARLDLDRMGLVALRAALTRYLEARGP